jgi:hypothetical protein
MQCMASDLNWWITVIEIPVITGLFWMIWRTRDELSSHRLKVAEDYAERGDVKSLEQRLTSYLLRIEAKLDVTALKAERNDHERRN